MEQLAGKVDFFNTYFWYFVTAFLVVSGVYFCIRTLMVQLRYIPDMFRAITEKPGHHDDGTEHISSFKAFTISAASRVGTGNVAGVAIAITAGGPGAVFWMWLLALVGGATSFIESTLAQVYKVRDRSSYRGGPAYYMTKALKWRWLAVVFAVVITLTYAFVFNAVQSNSIANSMATSLGGDSAAAKAFVGFIIAGLTGLIIFGGVNRIANITQVLVPVMAVSYIGIGLIVVALHIGQVPEMFKLIFENAFGLRQVGGATLGYLILKGIQRGLFSNEAGMGSAPNAAATASVSHPAKQGLIQTLGVYFDTWVVCSITAFIILLSGVTADDSHGGVALTQQALAANVGSWGTHYLTIVILFLAFSSIIGNYYYGETNIEYFTTNKTVMFVFRCFVLLCVFGGAIGSIPLVWNLADTFSGIMVTTNLIALIPLGGVAVALLKHYTAQRAQGLNPVFLRDDLPGLKAWEEMECWDGTEAATKRGPEYDQVSYDHFHRAS